MVSSMLEGFVLEVDYTTAGNGGGASIRLTVKCRDGSVHKILDPSFKPYFYLIPRHGVDARQIAEVSVDAAGEIVRAAYVEETERIVRGKPTSALKVYAHLPAHVPKLGEALAAYGTCHEYDIPFAKRYLIDKRLTPFKYYLMETRESGGALHLISFKETGEPAGLEDARALYFDIEVYNPRAVPMPATDPVIMISYLYAAGGSVSKGVLTYKRVALPFVETLGSEKEMIGRFMQVISESGADLIIGYNSANFDVRYLIERARAIGMEFNMSRFEGQTRIERHGLVDRVKVAGRAHIDAYLVARFVAKVGASERILKLNRYTLKDVYEAVSGNSKLMVEKRSIHSMWDGTADELETLATYNMGDTEALEEVSKTFMPVMIEITRITGNTISDVCVSTTGQLNEFLLMRYATEARELIPNKPDERETRAREASPIEGAYVKTPDPGIYDNLAVFDFRGLYPSIIISHNIDPSTICTDCTDYYESPAGTRFSKRYRGIMPSILRLLVKQRADVKKQFKKEPDNIYLGARSTALKILSNSIYGYMGYARSRWYSRECASSVTAYGRMYIKDTIAQAEQKGFKVIYSDTDSIVMLLGSHTPEDALRFMREVNAALPESMELELEEFYSRGIFVGKREEKRQTGAKKKYAMITHGGRIKIRGFELVRRDWSRIARETQMRVLESILRHGSAEEAALIVRQTIERLRHNDVALGDLVISTELRKPLDSYDLNAPEISAARKALKSGVKTRNDLEFSVIGYIITKHGNTISDKAEIEGIAKDYDADYYINNQLLPAVMRILKALNYTPEQLKLGGSQRRL